MTQSETRRTVKDGRGIVLGELGKVAPRVILFNDPKGTRAAARMLEGAEQINDGHWNQAFTGVFRNSEDSARRVTVANYPMDISTLSGLLSEVEAAGTVGAGISTLLRVDVVKGTQPTMQRGDFVIANELLIPPTGWLVSEAARHGIQLKARHEADQSILAAASAVAEKARYAYHTGAVYSDDHAHSEAQGKPGRSIAIDSYYNVVLVAAVVQRAPITAGIIYVIDSLQGESALKSPMTAEIAMVSAVRMALETITTVSVSSEN